MKTLLAEVNSPPPSGGNQPVWAGHAARRRARLATFVLGAAVLCVAAVIPLFGQQPAPTSSLPNAKCVIGCENMKMNSTGTLSLLPSGLEFATEKNKAEITIASITGIFTGNESRQDITGPEKIMSMGIPYGGGRILSLFSHKVEVLTVEYTGSNGGFHGAVFVLPAGHATSFRNQLVAQGAKPGAHVEIPAAEEKKP